MNTNSHESLLCMARRDQSLGRQAPDPRNRGPVFAALRRGKRGGLL